jgi:hypothetical protein
VGAAYASAASLAVTASPNPVRPGARVTLTHTGSGGYLILAYNFPNTQACAPTSADARQRGATLHGTQGFITTLQVPSSPFNTQAYFVPAPGASVYRICSYLYTTGDDSQAPDALGTTFLRVYWTAKQCKSYKSSFLKRHPRPTKKQVRAANKVLKNNGCKIRV